MKSISIKSIFAAMLAIFILPALAQDSTPPDQEEVHNPVSETEENIANIDSERATFLLTGFTNLTYQQDLGDIENSKFDHAGFSPIGLWKPSEKIFFEAELHIEMEGGVHGGEIAEEDGHNHSHGGEAAEGGHDGSTHFDIGYINMVYFLKPNLMFSAGKFLTPIGIFNERYHPTWINTLPVDPLGMGHGGPLPSAELGIQLRGAFYAGSSKLTYAIYVSNGPILDEGEDSGNAGRLIYTNFSDNNGNKAIGGRLSYFPISDNSLEIGVSGQYAGKTGDRGTRFENIGANIYSFDLTYIKNIGFGLLKFSGQYATIDVEEVEYLDTQTTSTVLYTFDNESTFYYGVLSLRPIRNENEFIRNSELSVRYESGKTPEGSNWHRDEQRLLLGYTHWLHTRTAFKIAGSFGDNNVLYAQFALGF